MASDRIQNTDMPEIHNIQGYGKPDFLVIGAARSGTTWLYHRLKRQSNLFVPPVKEIHYFDIQRAYPVFHWIRLRRMLLHMRRYLEFFQNKEGVNRENAAWLLKWGARYFLLPRTHSWYSSLFEDEQSHIAGELTPAYATLTLQEVREVRSINPEMKIIYQMRDPVARAWSQTVMNLGLHRRIGEYEQYKDEIRKVISSSEVLRRSDYLTTMDIWESVFEREQICYLFYDEISDHPSVLLEKLLDFIGLKGVDEKVTDETVSKRVGQRDTGGRSIPADIERDMAKHFLPMVEELERRFDGGYPSQWRQRYERLLE
ncbi:sulfotransferase [Thiohalophilus sp.]|uniref:sulfotransferase n=1 Tax=Thiohalophilus sp. TaxID=3028392 RepID=UPI002ACD6D2F|nr:sulfotransferase [Thiohalophilus sp.]MDZ7804386.1 sulfotransferase [Thiohalophilus sp.]